MKEQCVIMIYFSNTGDIGGPLVHHIYYTYMVDYLNYRSASIQL